MRRRPDVTVLVTGREPDPADALAALADQTLRRRHPDAVQVLAPGADPAGRYLLHLDAADRAAPEALQRLVDLADRTGADVVLGRTGGDADPPPPGWALGGIALLRRELLERHALRHRADLPVDARLPFTLEACLRAHRVAVLDDYDCLRPPRPDPGAATARARHEDRLRALAAALTIAEQLAEPGTELTALRARLLGWDLPRLLRPDFLTLDEPVQRRVCAGVGRLVDHHGDPAALQHLTVRDRLRLDLARRGRIAALRRLIRYQAAYGELLAPRILGTPEPPATPSPPTPSLPLQVWRGLVPPQVRRSLRRRPVWLGFAQRAYARWG
ncbi:hypothetical protein GCM10009738_65600 [Kitasatospora viridis]|uniref:TarS/TarP linker domain-containing protein n=1 Tax=Kitasatospora viridis TaxID=281105 RepID=A0A561UKD0_9ACTN|nr:hypothetical protein FHX73_113677 [Kitasatospora viridis]